jgi:membrane protein YdbS with pleckstrin-like domain
MTGSRDTLPAPELPAERRLALVVATTTYADPALSRLRSPARDAVELADTLADPALGGFQVATVADRTVHQVRVALEDFLADRNPADLLLVYLSCHGLLDARGRLHLAASDTLKVRLSATGVGSGWLLEQMEDCRARRQVLVLDCCFSGAFDRGAKSGQGLDLGQQLGAHSRGRVVLTASRASEYSFEGDPVPGSVTGSVFTTVLLDGLRTGRADLNNDGYISVDEAYDYAYAQVRAQGATQTPQRWVYGAEGESIVLARSPAGITVGAASLPESIRSGLDNALPEVREGAVRALERWLYSPDPARMLAARQALHRISDTDVATVAAAARRLLEAQVTPRHASAAPAPRHPRPVVAYPAAEPGPPAQSPEPDAPGVDSQELVAPEGGSAARPAGRLVPLESEPSAFVSSFLFPTERFRGEWARHPIFIAKRAAIGVILALLAFIGTASVPGYVDSSTIEWLPASARYWVAAMILAWTAWSAATWRWHRLVLTNKRIMLVSGLLRRRASMVPLLRVTDMKYTQTPLGRILNYGTFELESAGRFDRMRRLWNVPNPNEIYLRIVEEMYEPAAVEARIGSEYEDNEDDRQPEAN